MTDRSATADGFTDEHLADEALAEIADAGRFADEPGQPAVVSAQEAVHLARCPQCREALAATERVITALQAPISLEEPPPGLWDRISAELDEDTASAEPGEQPMATVHQLRPRQVQRRAPWWGVLAAAAAGAVIGGAVIAGLLGQESAEEEAPTASPVGGATLEPVAAEDFTGNAEMVELGDGSMELTVEISAAPDPADGYFEVWLRDEEASQLISLGAVTAESTTLQVPAGIDLTQYPVVDVSHEHFDGDPSHSGVTLAAGPMEGEGD